ncbi:hypothetical protein [Aquipseudomonas ullengensis]|uniref:Uncharacterized protein n=1 Tax=Aquipseudomonas ullengensis TaxID=2759166 RepID=A0A7W4QBH0_9GAMM|nr:hypothetical protein [Pseudomonas ullengensis]MBB2496694.1 hypothetical protein [Pseudomonas ullengensis]
MLLIDKRLSKPLTHGPRSNRLNAFLIPARHLVVKHLHFQVFTLGVMEDGGNSLAASALFPLTADIDSICTGHLVAVGGFPPTPHTNVALLLVDDQWRDGRGF